MPNSDSDSDKTLALTLDHYRNHRHFHLMPESKRVVITGPNGSGKTNILEALSFLSPGRGLRHAKLTEIGTQHPESLHETHHWSIFASIQGPSGVCSIGTGIDPAVAAQAPESEVTLKRVVKINHDTQKTQLALPEYVRIVWLTPQMEPLLLSGASARRRFVDRIVFHFDIEHSKRINLYDRTMRERSKLLQSPPYDPQWLKLIEERLAALSVAVAAARMQSLRVVMEAMDDRKSSFPQANLSMVGEVDHLVATKHATEAEMQIADMLAKAREKDRFSGQTSVGAHRSDLEVIHRTKATPLKTCSTGEQKAMLVAVILAEVRATIRTTKRTPILLLDEIVVHLDAEKRHALFDAIMESGAECWLTATEFDWFVPIKSEVQHLAL